MRTAPSRQERDRLRHGSHSLLPRYTSYPTMDRFVEAFTGDDQALALRQRRAGVTAGAGPLALYVHVPFCESLRCFSHGNKTVSRPHQQGMAYLQYLGREVDLQTAELGAGKAVSRLCIGGAMPTFLRDEELGQLLALLGRGFSLDGCAELSIEVDPRTVDAARLLSLRALGFNQIDFGVQEFGHGVRTAVNRVHSTEHVFNVMQAAREARFSSVGVDLIVGSPGQSLQSMGQTMALAVALRPDRIALYSYAHEPSRAVSQRRLGGLQRPSGLENEAMLTRSVKCLLDAGYVHLGMDDFALPHHELVAAKRQGRLQRDFQGYHGGPDGDLIAMGVSAAGRMGATYSQNARTLAEYCDGLDQGRLPVARGLALTRDDLVRRAVIMALMCQGHVSFEGMALAYLLDFSSYFASELAALKPLAEKGWVTVDRNGLQVTTRGLFELQSVAAVFDRYLQTDRNRQQPAQLI